MSNSDPNLQSLAENGNVTELARILRRHPDPAVRAQSAALLAGQEAPDLIEELIRASLGDPEQMVRQAARNALEQLLGKTTADQAVAAYGPVDEDDDDWDGPSGLSEGELDDADEEGLFKARASVKEIDLFAALGRGTLEEMLSTNADPAYRARAAEALGRLGSQRSVEALIRAVKADPDEAVSGAAEQALGKVLDPATAAAALDAYGDVNLEEYQQGLDRAEDAGEETETDETEEAAAFPAPISSDWTEEQIHALVGVLTDDRDAQKQLKALEILAGSPSLQAIDAITWASVWSEQRAVREAAVKVLEGFYGDETAAYLEEYKKSHGDPDEDELDGETDDQESDDQESDDQEDDEDVREENASILYGSADNLRLPPTIQEEKGIGFLPVALIILVLAIIFLVVRLLLH